MGPITRNHSTPLSPLLLEGAAVELPLLEDHEAAPSLTYGNCPNLLYLLLPVVTLL